MEFGIEIDKFIKKDKKVIICHILKEICNKLDVKINIVPTLNDNQVIINLED